jgi:type I restriction enzyme S subunit
MRYAAVIGISLRRQQWARTWPASWRRLAMAGEWRETTVSRFSPFTYGKGLPEASRISSGDVPVFGSNGIVGRHDASLTQGPTVVIGRKGTVGAVHYSRVPCWPIDTTFYLSGTDEQLIRFRYYVLKSLGLEHMNTDSAVPGLNRNAAHARILLIPEDEDEQRAIAHILGALDDKIELNRRMNATLEGMARALFQSWFVDFDPVRAKLRGEQPAGLAPEIAALFPNALVETELGAAPVGWEMKYLGDVMELAYGKALKAENRRDGSIPVFGSNGQIGWHDEILVSGPGVVVGRKGNPGVVTWVPTDFFAIDTTFFVKQRSEIDSVYFLYFALQAQGLASLSADSAVPGLNRNMVYMNKQVMPPQQLIQQFEIQARHLFSRVYRGMEEARTLAALRDALLPRLISGQLRVADAERIAGRSI